MPSKDGVFRLLQWLGLSAIWASTASGQRLITVTGDDLCRNCRIEVRDAMTIDGSSLDGTTPPYAVVQFADGSLALNDGPVIKIFSPTGRFQRQVGRVGGGPGEYQYIRNLLVDANNQLLLIDPALQRLSTFDQSGKFVGSVMFPVPFTDALPAMLTRKGDIVVNAVYNSASDAGFSIAVMSAQGQRKALLDESSFDRARTWRQWRSVSPRHDGGLYVGNRFGMDVVGYSPNLQPDFRLVRRANWLKPHTDPQTNPSDGLFDIPAASRLRAAWEDAKGTRLWLYFTVSSPDWRPGPALKRGQRPDPSITQRPLIDSVVELVDLGSGRVVARHRVAGFLGSPMGNNRFMHVDELASGERTVTVRVLTFHEK